MFLSNQAVILQQIASISVDNIIQNTFLNIDLSSLLFSLLYFLLKIFLIIEIQETIFKAVNIFSKRIHFVIVFEINF